MRLTYLRAFNSAIAMVLGREVGNFSSSCPCDCRVDVEPFDQFPEDLAFEREIGHRCQQALEDGLSPATYSFRWDSEHKSSADHRPYASYTTHIPGFLSSGRRNEAYPGQ